MRRTSAVAFLLVLGASGVAWGEGKLAPPAPASPGWPELDPVCAGKVPKVDGTKPPLGHEKPMTEPIGEAFFVVPDPIEPRAGKGAPLEVRLALPAKRKAGAPLGPAITVANTGTSKLSVLRPLDGSFRHGRFPHWDLYVRDVSTQQTYRFGFAGLGCGNANAPRSEDHLPLEPGKSATVKPDGWASYLARASIPLQAAGTYDVWIVYTFCGYKPSLLDVGTPVVRKDAIVGTFASNAVRVVVE